MGFGSLDLAFREMHFFFHSSFYDLHRLFFLV